METGLLAKLVAIEVIKSPLGEEIFFSIILPFIAVLPILWILSKILKLKHQNFLTALWVSSVYIFTSFLIRSISLILSLPDSQKPPINITAMIVSNVLLIILIRKVYRAKWWKTFLSWFIAYLGRFMIGGIITIIMLFSIPALTEDIRESKIDLHMNDFDVMSEIGNAEKIGNNNFIVYRSKILTPISIWVVNLKSDLTFLSPTKNVHMNMICRLPSQSVLFSSLKDETNVYKFESFPYRDLNFNVTGETKFSCYELCKMNNIVLNSGMNFGSKIVSIGAGEKIKVGTSFVFRGEDTTTMDCDLFVISESPAQTIKKSFTIQYIAD